MIISDTNGIQNLNKIVYVNMVTMTKLSDTISSQEYEKKRDKVIELLTKIKDEDTRLSSHYMNSVLSPYDLEAAKSGPNRKSPRRL